MSEDFIHAGLRIKIIQDEDAGNPRKEFDEAGKMICWHSRYNLGDDHDYSDPEHFFASLFEDIELTDEEVRLVLLGILRDEDGKRDYCSEYSEWEDRYTDKSAFRSHFVKDWINDSRNYLTEDHREKVADIVNERYVILPLYLYDHSGLSMSTGGFSCPWDSGQVGYVFISNKEAAKEWPDSDEYGTSIDRAIKYLKGTVETYSSYLEGDVWGYVIEEDEDGNDLGEFGDSCWGFYGGDYCTEEAKGVAEHIREKLTEDEEETRRREAEIKAHLDTCSYDI